MLLLIVGIFLPLFVGCEDLKFWQKPDNKDEKFDYLESDLSDYISLDSSAYKSVQYTNTLLQINDFDVENEIVKVLCKNKITPEEPIINIPNVTLGIGDVANIYYLS